MKWFLFFFSLMGFAQLVKTEPVDPTKMYLSQFATADKTDHIIAHVLAMLYRFLPDNTEHAARLKNVLGQEFKNKFGVSIKGMTNQSYQQELFEEKLKFVTTMALIMSGQARLIATENFQLPCRKCV